VERTGTDGGGVGIKYKIVRQSTEIGVDFMFVEIMMLNRLILVGLVYRPPNSSIVYRGLESGDYGLEAFEGVSSDLLSLYGEVLFLVSVPACVNDFYQMIVP
jgi:hypothetical protein